MKKILALLVCLLTVSMAVRADDDRPVRFDKKYEVIFASSSKVEFFKDGTWKEVDCKYSAVPEAVIPEAILRYVKTNYPGHKVVKIEKEDRGYEAKLANGMKLEFDKKFNLVDIDN